MSKLTKLFVPVVLFASMLGCAKSQSKVGHVSQHAISGDDNQNLEPRITQLEQELATLKISLADLKEKQLTQADVDAMRPALARPTRPSRVRPDPSAVYAAPIADAPSRGSKRPLVTMVRAYEHACPYCEKSNATMDELLKKYPKDLKIVYKTFIVHPQSATYPAKAVCAAHQQGKFHKLNKLIWKEAFTQRKFTPEFIDDLAWKAGLRKKKYKKDFDGVCADQLKSTQEELRTIGVRGTPAFFINGRFLSGARPVDQFTALIDEELAKAKALIKSDTSLTRKNYYSKMVLEKGLKSLSLTGQ